MIKGEKQSVLCILGKVELMLNNRNKIQSLDTEERISDVVLEGKYLVDIDSGFCYICKYQEGYYEDIFQTLFHRILNIITRLNEKYSILKNTNSMYPVPAVDRYSSFKYADCETKEYWVCGDYADNRWEYMNWLHIQLLDMVIENNITLEEE